MEATTSILCQAEPKEKKIPEEESDTVRTHKISGRDQSAIRRQRAAGKKIEVTNVS
jgi:hypothetical protein